MRRDKRGGTTFSWHVGGPKPRNHCAQGGHHHDRATNGSTGYDWAYAGQFVDSGTQHHEAGSDRPEHDGAQHDGAQRSHHNRTDPGHCSEHAHHTGEVAARGRAGTLRL